MTDSEVDRICRGLDSTRAGLLDMEDAALAGDPQPDCEFGPCCECLRANCPDRLEE